MAAINSSAPVGGSASGGSAESEAHGSEVDEPAAAATCNGSVCHCVAGRLKKGGVKCQSAIDAFADQLVWYSLTVYRLASSVSFLLLLFFAQKPHTPPPLPLELREHLLDAFEVLSWLMIRFSHLDRWAVGCTFLRHQLRM